MYETELLESLSTMPLLRLRCAGDKEGCGGWLPLKQDWSTRWTTLYVRYKDLCADRVGTFETRDSDVFVVTFMKAGTTWMQELAWLLLNKLDFERAGKSFTMQRSPFLDYSANSVVQLVDSITVCDELASPRLIKTHLPAQLLPRQIWQEGRKIIYVARNPKDVVVSSYHFMIGLEMWKGDFDKFVDEFITDKILYTSFWSHVVDFWRMRNEPNIFFVTYEEMKRDLRSVIGRLCKFLNVNEVNEQEMEQLLNHLSFENMKSGKYSNLTEHLKENLEISEDFEFMRRGIVGAYKDELTAEQKDKLDKWTSSCLKEYGIREWDIFGNT